MPIVIATIAASAATIAALNVALGWTLTAYVVGGLVAAGVSYLLRGKPKAPNIGPIPGRSIDTRRIVRKGVQPARWVLGRARVGGAMVFLGEDITHNSDPERSDGSSLHMAIAISEAPIEGIEGFWLGADWYPVSDMANDGLATIVSGRNKDQVKAWFHLSGDGTGGAALRSAFPTKWTSSHEGNGVAWCHMRLHQPSYKYANSASRVWSGIPEIQFLVEGLKFTWPGQATAAWTENAAAVWYWWLTARRGLPPATVDPTAFAAAYAVCNKDVFNHLRYSVNGTITAEDQPEAIEEALAFAFQGAAVEWNGTYLLRPGVDRPSAATIDTDHIIAVNEARPAAALADRINEITGAVEQSAEHEWLEWRAAPLKDTIAQDFDGEVLAADMGTTPFVAYPDAMNRMMAIAVRRLRAAATWIITVRPGDNLEFMALRPADFVTVTEPTTGLNNDLCFVEATTLNNDWSVTLAIRKHGTGIYADDTGLSPYTPGRTLDFPTRDQGPPAPTGLAATAAVALRQDGGIEATITASADDSVYRTHWRLTGPESQWITTQGEDAVFIVGKLGTYTLTARHLSSFDFLGAAATLSVNVDASLVDVPEPVLVSVTQLGDLAQLVFENLPERFIAALDVRASSGPAEGITILTEITATNWDTAGERLDVPFMSPSIGSRPLVANVTIPETARYRLFIRLVDTWGNYSDVVELGYYVFALPTVPTVASGYWPLWPGTLVNFYAWTRSTDFPLLLDRDSRVISRTDWNGEGGWPFGEASDNAADAYYQPPDVDLETIKTGEVTIDYEQFVPTGATATASVLVEVWMAAQSSGLGQAANRIINQTKQKGDFSISANYTGRRYARLRLTYRDGTKNVAVKRLSMNIREAA